MLKLGEKQTLIMVKPVDFGVYLAESQTSEERVLLPKKQVPKDLRLHDPIRVFLYKDSSDRLIATTSTPYITIGAIAVLRVKQTSKIGAFLDWGLEKDLFLPYKEQLTRLRPGDEILVRMYIDKSSRLCASMRGLYEELQTDSLYQKGDVVTGRVYEFSQNFGTFVAVDDRFSGRIPPSEDHSSLKIGQVLELHVTGVKADGKLDLSLREKSWIQMEKDAEDVLALIDSYGGVLPFNDKASPETIMREAKMSKNAFKRAVGRLYKERLVEFTEKGIRRV